MFARLWIDGHFCIFVSLSVNDLVSKHVLANVCAYVNWAQSGFKCNMHPGLCMHWCGCAHVHVRVCVWGGTERQRDRENVCPFSVCVTHVSQSLCGSASAWVGMFWCLLSVVCLSLCLPSECISIYMCVWERKTGLCCWLYLCINVRFLFFTIHPSTHLFISIALTFTGYLLITLRQITKFLLHLSFLIYEMEMIGLGVELGGIKWNIAYKTLAHSKCLLH